ncbi:MAG: 2-C-methyl-D-erythritol 4-phosphate cytidylyltransferase [Acutalibacteraceae bacterium]
MIYGAILAGGSGTRMHISSMPKQFLPLGEKPIIIHTLEKMLMCSRLDVVYLGINQSWMSHMTDLLERYGIDTGRVKLAAGGENRNETIFNIIDEIDKDFGLTDSDIIVTHDAVRPFVTLRILNDNIDAAQKYGACDTVVSATDTIVKSENGTSITEIPNRGHMYQGQTPQSFKISLLKEMYAKLNEEQKAVLTDACKICVLGGVEVKLVDGEISNMKITTVNDYKIAQILVGGIASD